MAHSSRPSSPLCDAVPKTVEPVVDPPLANMARPAVVEDYSSEDELDELDDMLDEFHEPKPAEKEPKPAEKDPKASIHTEAGPAKTEEETTLDDGFARQLQIGMADLLSEMSDSNDLQEQFEHLMKELSDATASTATTATTATTAAKPASTPIHTNAPAVGSTASPAQNSPKPTSLEFQERIKQTMDRMKSSEAEVDAAVADTDTDNFLAEMLKQMQAGAGDDGGNEDFSNMLVNMMEQLTSKDILYEPMKELDDKYPEWLRKNEDLQPAEDLGRYKQQASIVKEIVMKFEGPGYRDDDEACREYIVERMQLMQAAGAPPVDLIGDMGQGFDMPSDFGTDCGVQ